jgi:ATPase family protein associated with various cellular activities (AAA)
VMYLLHAMPGRTTILLTGRGLGLIEQALAIGRDLAPATFVFEDIDLVAAERTMEFGSEGVLFELLNQMEGLAEDEDLLFLLTTNRPDLIERSEGVSGAFIKELARQAWLRAGLERSQPPTAQDLRRVLDELLEERSTLTRRLLGLHDHGETASTVGALPAMQHALSAAGLPIPPTAQAATRDRPQ